MNRFILCLFCAAALVSSCGVKSFGPEKPDVEENVSDTVKQLRRLAAMELIEERDSTQTVFYVNKYEGGVLAGSVGISTGSSSGSSSGLFLPHAVKKHNAAVKHAAR